MNKFARLSLQLSLSMVLLFSSATGISAENAKELQPVKGKTEVVKTWRVTESGLVEMTPEQVDQLYKDEQLNTSRRDNAKANFQRKKMSTGTTDLMAPASAPPFCGNPCFWDTYSQYGSQLATMYSERRRVTPPVFNLSSATFTVNESYTYTVNLTLTQKIKDAFQIALGGSWANTSTYQNAVTPTAPANKYAWYDFTPIKSNSYGTVVHWENSTNTVYQDVNRGSEWVDLYMTRKVGSYQDGIFQQVISDYAPTY